MIIDGGLGFELLRRGATFRTKLWSAEAILTAPDLLRAVHADFIAAGARVIATATYQLSHAGLRELGHDDRAIDAVFARAVELVREAVAAHRSLTGTRETFVVAASLGPYGATVGDGSEYSGVQHLDRAALHAFHLERLRSVMAAEPDVVLFETIPTAREALVIAEVARAIGVPRAWLSFSCADGRHTFGGDAVGEIAASLEPFTAIEAIGVNCTAPGAIASLLRELRAKTSKTLFACPNIGQHWEADTHGLSGGESEAAFLRFVPEWVALGADHIGGCCGVGPATIAALAADVNARPVTARMQASSHSE